MNEREKKYDEDKDDMNENRGGRKEGGTPDYEKNQSSPISDKDYDIDKTKMT
jgi:hypothetical protein